MAGAMMVERAGSIPAMEPMDVKEYLAKLEEEQNKEMDEEQLKENESKVMDLGKMYREQGNAEDLGRLIKLIRPFTKLLSKAKAAKLIRGLVDMYLDMGADTGYEVTLCKECITWATEEKRIFLRQALEARLVGLYYDTGNYQAALADGAKLLKELKKLDDKNLLVEVQLLESKTYCALSNLPRARAALTSARTTANSIYVPPRVQAQLDLQSGILHASEEKDFKTAFSYFYESFENFDSISNPRAVDCLKYMLLCKIMMNAPEDVTAIVNGKPGQRHTGPALEAMLAVANAHKQRSLHDFEASLTNHASQLKTDPIISRHLDSLYDMLMQENICRIIEPYSTVETAHIATLMNLPVEAIENKLSQMILDKKFKGILDAGAGCLIVYNDLAADTTYEQALDTLTNMGSVVDALYDKARALGQPVAPKPA